MKITSKRLVSILLCLAMVLAVLPVAAMAEGTTRLYCAAPASWSNCNVYYWGNAAGAPTWPGLAMTKGADGLWYYDIPSDATNVIFNNGSAQSADLTMPTDDKVQYNYDAKEWVTYGSEVEEVETVYYLRGSFNSWAANETNAMTKQDDGTYAITMDLAAGSYEYKAAVADWSWSCPSGGNLTLNLEADDTVTFVLDLTANSLNYTLASGTVIELEYYLRGSMNEWAANGASKMTKQDDGTYAITLALEAGTYEYKAATADWSWSCPGGENAVLTLYEVADVTFVLNVAEGTVTNNAPNAGDEGGSSVAYDYYVAGSEGLCGVEWDPTQNQMTYNEETGLYEIVLDVWAAGTYEYKITTGSWETPSYGPAEGGNYTVVAKNFGEITITFNAETTEVSCTVKEFGVNELKFQLNADATAASESVDLRMITYVDSLDYSNVSFQISINGEVAEVDCQVVYEAINVNGTAMSCADIFGIEGYLVTYTLTDIPAEYYSAEINVVAVYTDLNGVSLARNGRSLVLSDVLA